MAESQKKTYFDAVVTAINMVAMGAGFAEGVQSDVREFELRIHL